jgi:predicted RNA binding protein YcfA (HicA-like mRNA interferase family)
MDGHKLPMLTSRDLIAVLEREGFRERPLNGTSHLRLVRDDGRKTTVPIHAGHDLSRGLLRKILRDVGMAPDELIQRL